MTDLEMAEFEARFERRMRAYASIPVGPIDPIAVARRVRVTSGPILRPDSAAGAVRRAISRPARVLPSWGRDRIRWMAIWVAVGLLIALSGWLVATGGPRPEPTRPAIVTGPSPSAAASTTGLLRTGELAYVACADELSPDTCILHLAAADGRGGRSILDRLDTLIGWAPTGDTLAAARSDDEVAGATVFIVDPTGGDPVSIHVDGYWDAVWSGQDELLIEAYPASGPQLSVYRRDGTLDRVLTWPAGVARLQDLAWSPDGRWILTEGCDRCEGNKYDDTPDLGWDLWRIDGNGGPATRITSSPEEAERLPRWTSNRDVAFVTFCWTSPPYVGACPDGNGTTISVHADGTSAHAVAAIPIGLSPDGLRVASESTVAGQTKIVIRDLSDGHQTLLSAIPGWDQVITWSPGGDRLLLWVSSVDPTLAETGHTSVWMVGADGSDPTRLVDGWGYGAWQPVPASPAKTP